MNVPMQLAPNLVKNEEKILQTTLVTHIFKKKNLIPSFSFQGIVWSYNGEFCFGLDKRDVVVITFTLSNERALDLVIVEFAIHKLSLGKKIGYRIEPLNTSSFCEPHFWMIMSSTEKYVAAEPNLFVYRGG